MTTGCSSPNRTIWGSRMTAASERSVRMPSWDHRELPGHRPAVVLPWALVRVEVIGFSTVSCRLAHGLVGQCQVDVVQGRFFEGELGCFQPFVVECPDHGREVLR